MQDLLKDFLTKRAFAVVGSFRNESKFAYQIVQTLRKKGYRVYPINPHCDSVDGIPCYPSLEAVPDHIDVINIVTPPQVTIQLVRQCLERRIDRVWLQPGAESREVIDFCHHNGIHLVYGLCIMLEALNQR